MAKTMNQKHLEMMNDPEYAKHYQNLEKRVQYSHGAYSGKNQDRPYSGRSSQAYGHYPISRSPDGVRQTIAESQKSENYAQTTGSKIKISQET